MIFKAITAVATLFAMGACSQTVSIPQTVLEGRQLQPPREGVRVGSLYYVREAPTTSFEKPAYLEALCDVNLDKYSVIPKGPYKSSDIDYSAKLEVSGKLSGLDAKIASIGLDGKFTDYFDYKIVNAKRIEITGVDAEKIFLSRGFQKDCRGYRNNVSKYNWAIYQVVSITYGDISFGPKKSLNINSNLKAKLESITPEITASLSNSKDIAISGTGLIISFTPIIRN